MRLLTILFLSAITVAAQQAKLSDLDGMAGCWERRDAPKKLLVTEQWMKPAGGAMLGMGRTVRDGKATDWEFMRIEQRGDTLVFIAMPRGNKTETEFTLTGTVKPGEVVFENPAHDFPQVVSYRFDARTLTGRIEGKLKDKPTAIDFPFVRTACP
jgi:hypothetical protein